MASQPRSRRQAVRDFKRQGILDAAEALFQKAGIAGTTMRAIAERAGYTAGALYSYYDAKDRIMVDLLRRSLASLNQRVRSAKPDAALAAFHNFFSDEPAAFDLLAYVLGEAARGGLSAEADRQVNGRLIPVLAAMAESLETADAAAANRAVLRFTAFAIGLQVLERSRRLETLGFDAAELLREEIASIQTASNR